MGRLVVIVFIFLLLVFGFKQDQGRKPAFRSEGNNSLNTWCTEGINELIPGDILVKPNVNLMPGTSEMSIGWGFGHAALVVKGYKHQNIDTLLSNVIIVESMARKVDQAYQIREIRGFVEHNNLALNCTSFSSKYAGNRYRLRLKLPQTQIDSIISFALAQKGDISCWNSSKSFPDDVPPTNSTRNNWADNSHWYCSLLVWQAVYYVAGFDLDVNGGYQVFPNDLIRSKYFDSNSHNFVGRAKF